MISGRMNVLKYGKPDRPQKTHRPRSRLKGCIKLLSTHSLEASNSVKMATRLLLLFSYIE